MIIVVCVYGTVTHLTKKYKKIEGLAKCPINILVLKENLVFLMK